MDDKPQYSHTEEFTKFGDADPLNQSMMALNAFHTIESLKAEVAKLTEQVDSLKRQIT